MRDKISLPTTRYPNIAETICPLYSSFAVISNINLPVSNDLNQLISLDKNHLTLNITTDYNQFDT